jgi:hypothetical protein
MATPAGEEEGLRRTPEELSLVYEHVRAVCDDAHEIRAQSRDALARSMEARIIRDHHVSDCVRRRVE